MFPGLGRMSGNYRLPPQRRHKEADGAHVKWRHINHFLLEIAQFSLLIWFDQQSGGPYDQSHEISQHIWDVNVNVWPYNLE